MTLRKIHDFFLFFFKFFYFFIKCMQSMTMTLSSQLKNNNHNMHTTNLEKEHYMQDRVNLEND